MRYRLRTLMVIVTLLCILLSRWHYNISHFNALRDSVEKWHSVDFATAPGVVKDVPNFQQYVYDRRISYGDEHDLGYQYSFIRPGGFSFTLSVPYRPFSLTSSPAVEVWRGDTVARGEVLSLSAFNEQIVRDLGGPPLILP